MMMWLQSTILSILVVEVESMLRLIFCKGIWLWFEDTFAIVVDKMLDTFSFIVLAVLTFVSMILYFTFRSEGCRFNLISNMYSCSFGGMILLLPRGLEANDDLMFGFYSKAMVFNITCSICISDWMADFILDGYYYLSCNSVPLCSSVLGKMFISTLTEGLDKYLMKLIIFFLWECYIFPFIYLN